MTTGGPLAGLLVVALEQAVAAPYCSSRLADAGARVIKIERAEGDFARRYDSVVHGESAYFVWLNRGKESLVLDIKDKADAALLHRILARADVFIQNLAPGAAARAGFDPTELRHKHPKLITCSISGYGDEGPYRDRKAYDLLVQAETGLCSVTGTPEAPGRVGVSVCDIAAGMYAYQAILEALIQRGQTGEGRHLSVSLFDGMADWMTVPLLHQVYGGKAPPRVGLRHPSIAPYGRFTTRDGTDVILSIQNEREWAAFCDVFMLEPTWASEGPYANPESRVTHREDLEAAVAARFAQLDRDPALALLDRARTAYGILNEVDGFAAHPMLRRMTVETPSGPVDLPAPPAIHDGDQTQPGAVPAIGEQSAAIREEFK
ncbi:CaiB/BaiF CoA-transferase family protein [Magnetospira sp. QH-2]|uniref:CaiB/BaiF CoA transferase family protein n=1 Tax=Magnetospira sp. (strain QH-2) TaxID=1288970 RepID=UPI0003E814FD|nr:CaiB/BaiF CoA-transferase family protein [Magnetospira sp. QH-2]CCQ74452.1 putative carnitine dehydratase/acyl-CoA transferases-related (COG1804) [Magnetospira sp. QH-2]